MGNNKKTVKCSFCNRLGHNRVTCPKLKKSITELEDKYGSNHPDVLEHKIYLDDYSEKSKKNATKSRYCSYCRKSSHNVRTCTERAKDVSRIKKLNFKWRTKIIQELQVRGIGVGSIISTANHISSIENKTSPWTVVSIDWDKVNWITDNARVFKIILMSNPAIQRELTLEQILNQSESYYHRWNVVSKSQNLDIPDKWDTISDPIFDEKCIEIFDGITKTEFDGLFMELQESASWLKSQFYREEEENVK